MKNDFQKIRFLKSAPTWLELPADQGAEIAFVGRSNAGKSSALNAITGVFGLARTSRTPGRTQLMNCFSLDDHRRLVDLPGYGYAKVPAVIRARFSQMIFDYLEKRESLKGLVLVMDSRHLLQPMDQQLIDWCSEIQMPLHILLTKADKLTTNEQKKALATISAAMDRTLVSAQLFSSVKHTGVEAARKKLMFFWGL